ncbi:TonB-dependent receptor plug domain-containing protein [Pseudemcibacter aquimaris]|uniref:TonB-dependent receptor plug domain-containing protein n=1 Tax=Pseudemcibacter aquimaris TaxID=2857064 RepID=UPI0020122312|nr:TonB-dependent receptor [Pseudemcibacter aquimaris]MCC3861101.1 outer membrane beta-barrel protein [Pseudemcibacter aquimaris]WDU59919.1 outer membrane beta-barrel protein [Pseudemcibacter aquimaris]
MKINRALLPKTCLFSLGTLLLAPYAIAQDNDINSNDIDSYDAAFFSQFNPQTALDIINQVPGFNIDIGEEIRGFGAGAGNVLIDGNRPTSKSGGLEDALLRIPASGVARVELLRGSATTGEASGQSVVANIIRNQDTNTLRWQTELEIAPGGILNPIVETTFTNQIDEWDTSIKLNGFKQTYPRQGVVERFDSSKELLYSESEDRPSTLSDVFFSGDARRKFNESTLQLNSRLGWSKFKPLTDRKRFNGRLPDDSPDSLFYSDYNSQFYEGELGADFTTPLKNDWTMKIVGLGTHQHWWYTDDTYNESPVGEYSNGKRVDFKRDTYESILRTTFTKGGNPNLRPEIGGEVTYNKLDGSIDITNIDISGAESSVFVPIADVTVQETRGEAFANLLWRPVTELSIESGITVEGSQIKVSRDASNKQSFIYFKPSLSVTYDFSEAFQIRMAARRSVGQLSFNDFVSTANVVDERVTSGNPELQPDKTTRLSLQSSYLYSDAGSINIEVFHEWKNDVLEFILQPNGIQGIGNAGNARLWGYNAALTVPVTNLLKGAQIKIIAEDRASDLLDPVTNENRKLTNISAPKIEINFRQNLTEHKLAWGFGFSARRDVEYFYVTEIDHLRTQSKWDAFIETSYFEGLLVRFEVNGIGKMKEIRERSFYNPSRATLPTGFETTNRRRGTFMSFIVSGQF